MTTPLHHVIKSNNAEDLSVFLTNLPEALINFQEPSCRNESVLHFAVIQDLPSMVEVLLRDQRVDVGLEDEDEVTAYMSAIYRGNVKIHGIFYDASEARTDMDLDVSAKMDKSFFRFSTFSFDYENDGYSEPSYDY